VYGFGWRNKLEREKFTCRIDLDCRVFLVTHLCLCAPRGQVGPERDNKKIQQEQFWPSFVRRRHVAEVDGNFVANGPFGWDMSGKGCTKDEVPQKIMWSATSPVLGDYSGYGLSRWSESHPIMAEWDEERRAIVPGTRLPENGIQLKVRASNLCLKCDKLLHIRWKQWAEQGKRMRRLVTRTANAVRNNSATRSNTHCMWGAR